MLSFQSQSSSVAELKNNCCFRFLSSSIRFVLSLQSAQNCVVPFLIEVRPNCLVPLLIAVRPNCVSPLLIAVHPNCVFPVPELQRSRA